MLNALHADPKELRESILRRLNNTSEEQTVLERDCRFFDAVARSVAAREAAAARKTP